MSDTHYRFFLARRAARQTSTQLNTTPPKAPASPPAASPPVGSEFETPDHWERVRPPVKAASRTAPPPAPTSPAPKAEPPAVPPPHGAFGGRPRVGPGDRRRNTISVALSQNEEDLIRDEAARQGVSMSDLIRQAVYAHLGPPKPGRRR